VLGRSVIEIDEEGMRIKLAEVEDISSKYK